VTWHEFAEQVCAVAAGFITAGIQPGDRVALMSRTRFEWTLLDYAILTAGGVTVPIYPTSSPEQVEWILRDSGAVAVIVETDAHTQILAPARASLPALAHVWEIDGAPFGDLDDIKARGAGVTPEQIEDRRHTRGAADLAKIVYTSGTTGRPKGCMLSHGNIVANTRNCMLNDGFTKVFNENSSTLLFLPLAHSYAQLIQYGAIYSRTVLGLVDMAELAHDPALRSEFQVAVDDANKAVSRAEAIKRFAILEEDFTEARGQLTPTVKVRRQVIMEQFAAQIAALYREGAS
jgi:long-chain acyl-CoA synthetase